MCKHEDVVYMPLLDRTFASDYVEIYYCNECGALIDLTDAANADKPCKVVSANQLEQLIYALVDDTINSIRDEMENIYEAKWRKRHDYKKS